MTDFSDATIEIRTTLSLIDYISLILWHARKVMLISILLFPVGMMGVGVFSRYLGFGSLEGWRYVTIGQWIYVLIIFFSGGALIALLPLLFTITNWLRGKLPRELHAVISMTGINLPSKEVDLNFHWNSATLLSKSETAYFLRFGRSSLRLPMRAFAEGGRQAFEKIAIATVPVFANKLTAR